MNSINTFLIERLKINKNTGLDTGSASSDSKIQYVDVHIPVVEEADTAYMNETWRTLKLPKAKYIVFLDKYRSDHPHFADLEDFIMQLCWCQDDYEGFNPDKDILFASNDLHKTLEFIFDYLNIDYPDEDNLDEWSDEYDTRDIRLQIEDNISVLGQLYVGEDNAYNDVKIINYDDLESILDKYFTINK